MPSVPRVPPVDAALSRRVEKADVEYVVARSRGLGALPGNPFGVIARRIGGATVLHARGMRTSMFNRVLLADDDAVPRLDEIIAAAGGPAVSQRFDVVPPLPSNRLMHALRLRGFASTGHFTALYGAPAGVHAERRFGGTVRRMRGEELDEWIDVYIRSFGIAGADAEPMGQSLRALPGRDEAVHLVAELDRRPAAITALWIDAGTGYVALCATLEEARGRGCQSALIAECARISLERGCDLVAAHAAVGSQSQRNFELCGFRIAFHKAIWTRPPARGGSRA